MTDRIKYTSQILDLLEKYDAKATFFVIGNQAEKYPELIRKLDDEGHEMLIIRIRIPIPSQRKT